jgi:hypothetical protein
MLHVIYRSCGGEDTRDTHKRYRGHGGAGPAPFERTEWFDKPTYFKSFAQELDDQVRVTIVYDGDRPLFRDYLRREWVERYPSRFTFHQIHANDNRGSLLECYGLADADTTSDYFYFLEDDYLHREGWLRVLREGFESLPQNAVMTLYDHRDRYRRSDDITDGCDFVRVSKSTHWRTAESTTCTWAIRRALWPRVRPTVMEKGLRDREAFRALVEQGIRLWQPIPGYSTHDHVKRLSPLVDWRAVRERL